MLVDFHTGVEGLIFFQIKGKVSVAVWLDFEGSLRDWRFENIGNGECYILLGMNAFLSTFKC